MARLETERPTFDDLELLTEVSQLLTILDLDGILERVVDLMVERIGAKRASLFLFDDGDIDWKRIIHTIDPSPERDFTLVPRVLDEGLAGWVIRHKEAALIADTETDERWYVAADLSHPGRSALCVPFIATTG